VHVIDALSVARDAGLNGQINTVMQVCFFALSEVLPQDEAIGAIKDAIRKSYGKRGGSVVEANVAAVDASLAALARLPVPDRVTASHSRKLPVPPEAPDFVQRVTARMLADEGDLLPVSAMPVDGVFPTGTARFEKRALAHEIPIWIPELCIDCARCALVCPHAAIRMKVYEPAALGGAPDAFPTKRFRSADHPGLQLTIQVAPEDCTGCGVCVDVCPAKSKTEVKRKSINMEPIEAHLDRERERFGFFLGMPSTGVLDPSSVKGSQVREPLFEFSGACSGCGETPYLKLLTQMFGDRAIIANATGCSSIYGGNLPTTPWGANAEGRGPAWSNSLFEDNAEFGLGMRLALDQQSSASRGLLEALASSVGRDLVEAIVAIDPATAIDDATIAEQRARVAVLDERVAALIADPATGPAAAMLARRLAPLTGSLIRKNVWIVGGDGWAYDIGSGGLDHVLGSGCDVNIIVLDTEVYSNTGGQASKATPRGAVAKFASGGKATGKKDIGAGARLYGDVYIAQVAIGANDVQTVRAFAEAEAWPGVSLIVAYSTCIAHGIDMERSMTHQKDAVRSGYWPLWRYRPTTDEHARPFQLDSKAPSIPVSDFALEEARFSMLARANPEHASELLALAQADVDERWRYYQQLAGVERSLAHLPDGGNEGESEAEPSEP